jgi:hypothetical protein
VVRSTPDNSPKAELAAVMTISYTASCSNGSQNSRPSWVTAANFASLCPGLGCGVYLSCYHRD